MADEDKSNRSRFLSRLRSRSSAKEDSVTAGQTQDLKQDVVDFLKPSTDRAALIRPRIDVAIAQRWPEAHSVDNAAGGLEAPLLDIKQMRRKRRREGLVVGFAATAPEVIGEGGDECPNATIEISRTKTKQLRPGFLPQRRSVDQPCHWSGPSMQNVTSQREESPRGLRRANTTYDHPSARQLDVPQPRLTTNDQRGLTNSPISTNHDRKRSIMTVNEGMALKRASSIPDLDADDDDYEHDDNDPPPHFGPGSTKNFSTPTRATQITSYLSNDSSNAVQASTAPLTAKSDMDSRPGRSNTGKSPFDDPKYNARSSNGVKAPRMQQSPAQQYPGQAQYAGSVLRERGSSHVSDGYATAGAQDTQYIAYTAPAQGLTQESSSVRTRISPVKRQQSQDVPRAMATNAEHTNIGNDAHASPAVPPQRSQNLKPDSANSDRAQPYARSAQPSPVSPSISEAALTDFATRVAHMKGVFSLTAEKERPADHCTPVLWLRSAYWWFLKGKICLELELRQRTQSRRPASREFLLQGHVDIAKSWWILSVPLTSYASLTDTSPNHPASQLHADYAQLRSSMQTLCLSLGRNSLMPPPASLIQGQDTRIWCTESTSVISSYLEDLPLVSPASVLPLGDTATQFCYFRSAVDIALSNAEGVDKTTLMGLLTVVRSKDFYQTDMIVATQDESISIRIGTDDPSKGSITWQAASWSSSMSAISIELPDRTTLHVRLQAHDYRMLGNMIEYSRNAVKTIKPRQNEMLTHKVHLSSLQYSSQSSGSAFPRGKVDKCQALLFATQSAAHRIVLVTDVDVKILSCASHLDDRQASIRVQDDAEKSTILEFRDDRRCCQAVLTFESAADKISFMKALNNPGRSSAKSTPAEAPTTDIHSELHTQIEYRFKMPLAQYDLYDLLEIELETARPPPTSVIHWESLMITHPAPSDDSPRGTEQLCLILKHQTGIIKDELDPAMLLMRLPQSIEQLTVDIYREPQARFSVSTEANSPPAAANAVSSMAQKARDYWTIRTIYFPTLAALHDFQTAVTGYIVRYDGIAISFAISRRMMVVPIHHKWTANDVRIQVLSNQAGTVVKVLAFLHSAGFEHADAMCFQVKSTDVFEKVKSDGKSKKWSIKLVDAKFSLPKAVAKNEGDEASRAAARLQRQFINVAELEYAGEHDDISIGFDTEEHRDLFARALPAAPIVSKGLTLRRRI